MNNTDMFDYIGKSVDISEYAEQNRMANDILDNYKGRPIAIFKTTRAGATVSIVKNALLKKKRLLIVEPTIDLFEKTVRDKVVSLLPSTMKPIIERVEENKELCLDVKNRLIGKDSSVLTSYPKCRKCYLEGCKFRKILYENIDVICITYQKLKFIMNSKNADYEVLINKISKFDVIVFDEFTIGTSVGLQFVGIKRMNEIKQLLSQKISAAKGENRNRIKKMIKFCNQKSFTNIDEDHFLKNKKEFLVVENGLHPENLLKINFFDFLLENMPKEYMRDIQKIVFFMSQRRFLLRPHKKHVVIEPIAENGLQYLRKFTDKISIKDNVFAVTDAWLPDFFNMDAIFGVDFELYNFGDSNSTESKQLIISGTTRFLPSQFVDKTDRYGYRETARKLLTSEYFVFNKALVSGIDMKVIKHRHGIKAVIEKLEHTNNFFLTWYRSVVERGIELPIEYRDIVFIGLPYLPYHAYIADTISIEKMGVVKSGGFGMNITGYGLHQIYKKNFEKSSCANMMGRVKDPTGKEKSVVFAFGTNEKTLRDFMIHSDPRYWEEHEKLPKPSVVSPLVNGEYAETAPIMALLWKVFVWRIPEIDLPILSRVVYLVNAKKSITTNKILHNLSENKINKFKPYVIPVIDKNIEILKQLGIEVKTPRGGGRRLVLLNPFSYNNKGKQ